MQTLLFLAIVSFGFTQLVKGQTLPDCKTKCGNVTIEYPFGLSPGCYYDEDDKKFKLTCDKKEKLKLFDKIEVISISPSGNLRILAPISYECYNSQGKQFHPIFNYNLLNTGSLTLSNDNSFIGVGCSIYAYLHDARVKRSSSFGCISFCGYEETGEPLYIGSCQAPVPNRGGDLFYMPVLVDKEDTPSNSCIYAFIVENGKFNWSDQEDLKSLRNVKEFPVVLDWSVGNETCSQVGSNSLCGRNSKCFDSNIKSGYTCKCDQGFDGNPYLQNGCKDVDECTDLRPEYRHNCGDDKYCENKEGSFGCNCFSGYRYDLKEGCIRQGFQWTPVLLGTIIGLLILLLGVGWIYNEVKRDFWTRSRR